MTSVALLAFVAGLASSPASGPARAVAVSFLAAPAPNVVGGGEVVLAVAVAASGAVTGIETLRSTPPYTDLVRDAVSRWRFVPATAGSGAVASEVIVAALVRPPVILGASLGAVPQDLSTGRPGLPLPKSIIPPVYPLRAASPTTSTLAGQVVLEVPLDVGAEQGRARILRGSPGFEASAIEALAQWTFSPPSEPANVYVILAFRVPVVTPPPPLD